MNISHIDHLVLTVADLERACDFYTRVLGFRRTDAPGKPTALHFGNCKLNVHAVATLLNQRQTDPRLAAETSASSPRRQWTR